MSLVAHIQFGILKVKCKLFKVYVVVVFVSYLRKEWAKTTNLDKFISIYLSIEVKVCFSAHQCMSCALTASVIFVFCFVYLARHTLYHCLFTFSLTTRIIRTNNATQIFGVSARTRRQYRITYTETNVFTTKAQCDSATRNKQCKAYTLHVYIMPNTLTVNQIKPKKKHSIYSFIMQTMDRTSDTPYKTLNLQ